MSEGDRGRSDSGMLVYPPMPVSKRITRRPTSIGPTPAPTPLRHVKLAFAGIAGIGAGLVLRPMVAPDKRIDSLEQTASDARKAETAQKERADGLDTKLAAATARLTDAEKSQSELESKAADAEKKAKDAEQAKLQAAVDKSAGSVSAEGDEIHLQFVDKVLFKLGDDQLTDRGKVVLGKVGAALEDLPDKQIWVQGHTDDQPIVVLAPTAKKPVRGKEPAPPPGAKFASNWELSAARALTVVHYLQDVSKVDPTRLAALAFGQYRPVSRSNKALNRRIEIVLVPKKAIIKR